MAAHPPRHPTSGPTTGDGGGAGWVTGARGLSWVAVHELLSKHPRPMIKCSTNLGCHMQATVLCQFLDEIDYSLAFKCISEKSATFTDAIDTYYSCIWDVTILEFIINLHAKKNEHTRKLQVISYMSQLELNANNNEEIKREAANNRKMKFLRALAKQYMLQEM
uniref:INTS8 TPR repeats domain-containing protein n=1 Tax=Phlebotomus papatasi TaxID=29031 RepID=A0A1B0D5L7_PHLPP